jgi:hypothetical protein
MTSRPSTAAPILAALAIVLLPVLLYAGGYYASCQYEDDTLDGQPIVVRGYRYAWQRSLFEPAAWLEQRLLGRDVFVVEADD